MENGVFEDYDGWYLPYRAQLIRVDTRSNASSPLVQLAVVSQGEVDPSANDELFDSTQELAGEDILDDMEEEEPDGRPGDMAADHTAFNILLVFRGTF